MVYPKQNLQKLMKRYCIKPMIKIQQEANKIFDKNIKWETKQIQLKEIISKEFKQYVTNLDLQSKQDSSKISNH